MESTETIHFPGLNNLRFLAAFVVLIFHQEYKKKLLGFEYHFLNTLTVIGDLGVTLFFVLSGFLITYLLLAEKKSTQTVSIKKFYVRRILRIWPLYYFILLLGFFVLPHIGFLHIPTTDLIDNGNVLQLFLFFFFFANIGFTTYGNLAYVDQTWSIAIEEQFYLLWPFIIKYVKRILPVLLLIIATIGVARAITGSLYLRDEMYQKAYAVLYYLRLDNMAVGGVFAYVLFTNKKGVLKLLYTTFVQYTAIMLLAFLMLKGYTIPYVHHIVYSVLFGIVIINVAANPGQIIAVKTKTIHYLGKISYGIYMYHNITIVIALKLCAHYLGSTSTAFFIISYIVSILLTLLLAHLSYQYFEKYFLSFKNKYVVVKSND